ncbi:MAG: DUF58 domain-containing protein [Kiritimatiellae bacterium]|nr:DUF58 domain-containing protein [Kiritimatiellia bacterium]
MIAPNNRLLIWTALLLPFAALGAIAPEMIALWQVLLAGLAVLAAGDAVAAHRRTRTIRVALPEVVRLSKDRDGRLPVQIANEAGGSRQLRIGLPLPPEIRSENEELAVRLPADSRLSRIEWPCTPTARGRYLINRCHFACSSPLGFWDATGVSPARTELRVYPNLARERKSLAALFLNRGNYGMHLQRMVGQGRDFEKLREYIPGDSYDDVHWKATAKRGRPVTKLYQIERTQEVYVVIDSSRLAARPSGEDKALERFITAALVLCLAAEKQGDLFGIVSFSDKVRRSIRAGGGRGHYNACRDALYTLTPQIVTPDFDDLCAFIRVNLRRRALLMFLTDLADPMLAESFMKNAELIRRQHLVMVNMILPPGTGPLFSGAEPREKDELYRRLGEHMRWSSLRELGKALQRRGVALTLSDDEKLAAQLVSQYLNIKQRQAL